MSLIFLVICIVGYLLALMENPKKIVPEKKEFVEQRGLIKQAWFWTYHTLWQGASEDTQAEAIALKEVESHAFWKGIYVIVALLLVWISFDTEKANHALAAFWSMIGTLFYLLLPNDAIPDIIPVAGVGDDSVVVVMGTAIAVSSVLGYLRSQQRERKQEEMMGMDFGEEYGGDYWGGM
jgi:uncharacterized membrane protein YkvA (DUF1232 family)